MHARGTYQESVCSQLQSYTFDPACDEISLESINLNWACSVPCSCWANTEDLGNLAKKN